MIISQVSPNPGLARPVKRADTYHGVLAHQHNSLLAERLSDLVHLLRADIVDGDDEDGLVLLKQRLELGELEQRLG